MTETSENASNPITSFVDATTDIVSAPFCNKNNAAGELPGLPGNIHAVLSSVSRSPPKPEAEELDATLPIWTPISGDALICLKDGKTFKRRLRARNILTPKECSTRYRPPSDHPMAAADYIAIGSKFAESMEFSQTRIEYIVTRCRSCFG
ncbi:MucR family transcriptional regulator [Labrenzia sp. THAF82]|uniref:MucR family transcriptional regulator n=1 Tax=Labrenzia sp. THAF82 TaxID=2587861 RepID=UPI001268F47A|nr:MucR family transcriptional regulator [Labrenzia sp. THAF82]